jgi:hypothetical protein
MRPATVRVQRLEGLTPAHRGQHVRESIGRFNCKSGRVVHFLALIIGGLNRFKH